MPNRRLPRADALAHRLFGKSFSELEPAERAELDALRAFDSDEADEQRSTSGLLLSCQKRLVTRHSTDQRMQ